jgi:hypothetical protein
MTPEPDGGGTLGSPALNTPPPGPGPWYRFRLHLAGQLAADNWVSAHEREEGTLAMARVLATHAVLLARAAHDLGYRPAYRTEVYDHRTGHTHAVADAPRDPAPPAPTSTGLIQLQPSTLPAAVIILDRASLN